VLDFQFATMRLKQRYELFGIHEFPRTTPSSRRCLATLMLGQATIQIIRGADVKPPGCFALENIKEAHRQKW